MCKNNRVQTLNILSLLRINLIKLSKNINRIQSQEKSIHSSKKRAYVTSQRYYLPACDTLRAQTSWLFLCFVTALWLFLCFLWCVGTVCQGCCFEHWWLLMEEAKEYLIWFLFSGLFIVPFLYVFSSISEVGLWLLTDAIFYFLFFWF